MGLRASFTNISAADSIEAVSSSEEKKVAEAATEAASGSTEDERPGQANSLEASEAKSRRRRAPIGMGHLNLITQKKGILS